MPDDVSRPAGGVPLSRLDVSVPHSARVWNYWLGGKDNFAADRELGNQVRAMYPEIIEIARASRGFLVRAVEFRTAVVGVRQFLDIGTGLPTADNTHEVAQRVAPEARIGVRRQRSARADARPCAVASTPDYVEFRLPTTGDLVAVEGLGADRARRELLARSVLRARRDGDEAGTDGDFGEAAVDEFPAELQQRIAEAAAEADPYADVTLNVGCPECGQQTKAELDIASYLWAELDAWARTTLLDVHLLATAYGWSEPEILALSPLRRRYYLELCADA